jgi:hypothetical protein
VKVGGVPRPGSVMQAHFDVEYELLLLVSSAAVIQAIESSSNATIDEEMRGNSNERGSKHKKENLHITEAFLR